MDFSRANAVFQNARGNTQRLGIKDSRRPAPVEGRRAQPVQTREVPSRDRQQPEQTREVPSCDRQQPAQTREVPSHDRQQPGEVRSDVFGFEKGKRAAQPAPDRVVDGVSVFDRSITFGIKR
ncbi:hypothetical protein [Shimazuella kribbensis]|uniref:hypothetical protein n=1 Tax=Shimazuella kribbensis TaxID=139808 RepID=UPI00048B6A96|nr:hypothetical protein [Shimazuella kribbensis]